MTLFQYILQLLILAALACSGLLILVALFAGYITLTHAWLILVGSAPALFALGLTFLTLMKTVDIEDPRSAARFDSMALGAGFLVLTLWAFRVNQRVQLLGGAVKRRISGAALALVIATGVMTVIESLNLVLWSAAEPVAWGVIWLDAILVLQVAVLALAFARERVAAAHRVQPDSAAYHPNGSPNAYPDAGYYRHRVAPGKPDPRRHPYARGDRWPVADPVAGTYANAGQSRRPAHAPRKP